MTARKAEAGEYAIDILSVPPAQLRLSALNPRALDFEDDEALDGLAASIALHGILEPLLVRASRGGFEIVAGNRRLAAVERLLAKRTLPRGFRLPCRVIQGDDAAMVAVSLIENLQRRDLNPIEEAQGYKTLIALDPVAWNTETVAAAIGKSRRHVQGRLALLDAPEPVQDQVKAGTLGPAQARDKLAKKKAPRDAAAEPNLPFRLGEASGGARVGEDGAPERPAKLASAESGAASEREGTTPTTTSVIRPGAVHSFDPDDPKYAETDLRFLALGHDNDNPMPSQILLHDPGRDLRASYIRADIGAPRVFDRPIRLPPPPYASGGGETRLGWIVGDWIAKTHRGHTPEHLRAIAAAIYAEFGAVPPADLLAELDVSAREQDMPPAPRLDLAAHKAKRGLSKSPGAAVETDNGAPVPAAAGASPAAAAGPSAMPDLPDFLDRNKRK